MSAKRDELEYLFSMLNLIDTPSKHFNHSSKVPRTRPKRTAPDCWLRVAKDEQIDIQRNLDLIDDILNDEESDEEVNSVEEQPYEINISPPYP